jgi:hypothetical protein
MRGRRTLTLELRDPVSGTLRTPSVQGELPADAEGAGRAARTLAGGLREAMPRAPARPASLLVTVDVDGASVTVDGEEIGLSPVAALDLIEGPHEVQVRRAGYLGVRRTVRVGAGEQARLDVTLAALSGSGENGAPGPRSAPAGAVASGGDVTGEWWFWTAIGGGAAVLIGVAAGIGAAVAGGQSTSPSGIPLPAVMGGM